MSGETIKDHAYVMGWPIGFRKQTEIAEAMKLAHEQQATHIVGCWCAETGFALMVEIFDGRPMLWHCTGPINSHQAKRWFDGFAKLDREDPVNMIM